jgi:hypothetical protein
MTDSCDFSTDEEECQMDISPSPSVVEEASMTSSPEPVAEDEDHTMACSSDLTARIEDSQVEHSPPSAIAGAPKIDLSGATTIAVAEGSEPNFPRAS